MKINKLLPIIALGSLLLGSAAYAGENGTAAEPAWVAEMRKQAESGGAKNPKYMPPVETRLPAANFDHGHLKFVPYGAAVVWDPANREALMLGGLCGGAEFGSVGYWALAADGKTWRKLEQASAALDPLRAKVLAARLPARDGENAARNVFYAGLEAGRETAEMKLRPAELLAEAVKLCDAALQAITAAKAEGWEKEGVARARPLVEKALAALRTAQAAFAGGTVSAELLAACFDGQWALDEAAGCLAAFPGERMHAAAAYDPANRCVVLFGGSHGDYVMSDTWIYDCASKVWRQVWPTTAPPPRAAGGPSTQKVKIEPFPGFLWKEDGGKLHLSGGVTVIDRIVQQNGYLQAPAGEWAFDAKTGQWQGQGGVAPGTRTYRTVCPMHDPRWLDGEKRGSAGETSKWLDALEPNTWTVVPIPERRASQRAWGWARFDPDRDQFYHWSGGHEADASNGMNTYHPAVNRWSIGFVPEIFSKGISFNGRPDCANHTYLLGAYDPLSRKLVCISMGGTGVYNPDRGDFDYNVAQPFNAKGYNTATVGTPRGVIAWAHDGQLWLFDARGKAWKKLEAKGSLPGPNPGATDCHAVCYDSKRDAVYMYTRPGGGKDVATNIWRYDLKTGIVQVLDPVNHKEMGIGVKVNDLGTLLHSVYVPSADLVIYGSWSGAPRYAYAPEQNRWVRIRTVPPDEQEKNKWLGNGALMHDAKRDMIWAPSDYGRMSVFKIDPKTLVVDGR